MTTAANGSEVFCRHVDVLGMDGGGQMHLWTQLLKLPDSLKQTRTPTVQEIVTLKTPC
jgi:hypothetical protein